MDEVKTTFTLLLKPTVYLIDEEQGTIDTSTSKVATIKIPNYSSNVNGLNLEQAKQALYKLVDASWQDSQPRYGLFYYRDSSGNKYSFKRNTDVGTVTNEISAELVDTTETTLTDIGWDD